MKKDKLLYLVSVVLVSIGIVLSLAAVILSFCGFGKLSDILFWVASLIGIISVVLIVIRLNLQTKDVAAPKQNGPKVVVKVVDVKDLPKTREQELYEQYEGLYKQKLISKEELDKKKEELLGKK